jgi:large subunit ribosomal protein L4
MKQKALFMAFSDKLATGTLLVVDSLDFSEYKTKKFAAMLDSFEKKVLKNDRRDILVLNESQDEKVRYSGRNLKGVKIINLENVNLVDLLNYKSLLLSEKAIKAISDRYNK